MYSLSLFFWGFLQGSIVHTALCGCCRDRNPGSHQRMGFVPCPSPLLSQVPSWKISLNLQWWGLIEKEYGWTGVFTAVKFAFAVCQFDYSHLLFITLICSLSNIMYLSGSSASCWHTPFHLQKNNSVFPCIIGWSLFIYLYYWANKLGSIFCVITICDWSLFLLNFPVYCPRWAFPNTAVYSSG